MTIRKHVVSCDMVQSTSNQSIYCSGRILNAIAKNSFFPDSKTFTELPLKSQPEEIRKRFDTLFPRDDDIDKPRLQQFLKENFFCEENLEPGKSLELDLCAPIDWKSMPQSFFRIEDKSIREFALNLHRKWPDLCRRVTENVKLYPNQFSLIPLKHPFFVPGGRFREMYYWDSYWTMKGLLSSEMYDSVRFMLLNIADLLDRFGIIPNGGRIYYLNRSQPPLYAFMVKDYYEKTGDLTLVRYLLPSLEKELLFWRNNRLRTIRIDDETLSVYQYNADTFSPRPEAYREDVELVRSIRDEALKRQIWHELASAAESGWDFSSRWMRDHNDLTSTEVTNIIPVDLNAFICGAKIILRQFYQLFNEEGKVVELDLEIKRERATIDKVFLDSKTGTYLDYNIRSKCHNSHFYPISFSPFFSSCFDDTTHEGILKNTFERMKSLGAWDYIGGVPASMIKTNEQWDFPNVWPPLINMVVESLRKSRSKKLRSAGFELAQKWVLYNYEVFKEYGVMFEKYEATGVYRLGSGGEYNVQQGFGWTNGVLLDLIITYKDKLSLSSSSVDDSERSGEPWYLHSLHVTHFSECKPVWPSISPTFIMLIAFLRLL